MALFHANAIATIQMTPFRANCFYYYNFFYQMAILLQVTQDLAMSLLLQMTPFYPDSASTIRISV